MEDYDEVVRQALSYAIKTIVDPSEHADAVYGDAEAFSEGAYWMMNRICDFLKDELHKVEVVSNGEDAIGIKRENVVFVDDNTPQDFIARLKEMVLDPNGDAPMEECDEMGQLKLFS